LDNPKCDVCHRCLKVEVVVVTVLSKPVLCGDPK